MHSRNATPKPINARMMRDRISSKCSRNDMRSMPSSSSSSSSGGGGGGGRYPPPAPAGTSERSSGDNPPPLGVSITLKLSHYLKFARHLYDAGQQRIRRLSCLASARLHEFR